METLQNGVEAVRHLFIPLILPALVISTVVVTIAMAKKAKKKALILSLPASIGATTWATGETIGSVHVMGLLILILFMGLVYATYSWSARYTTRYEKLRILTSIVTSVAVYVGVAYCVMNAIHLPFPVMVAIAFAFWVVFRLWDMRQPPRETEEQLAGTLVKGVIVLPVALAMLALQDVLAGVVVTFPFIAVFAAFEMRRTLYVMLTGFCRNSINILAFFVVVHVLQGFSPIALLPMTVPTLILVGVGVAASAAVLWALERLPRGSVLPRFSRWSKDTA